MPRGPIEKSRSTITAPTFTGQSKFADGTAAAPSITFASDPAKGFYSVGTNDIGAAIGGTKRLTFGTSTGSLLLDLTATTATIGFNSDTFLKRAAANILTMVNGNNAQYLRFDSGAQGAVDVGVDASGQLILASKANRSIQFGTQDTDRWEILGSGHLTAVADNTYDIGASGATRPRTVYVGTEVISPSVVATAGSLYVNTGKTVKIVSGNGTPEGAITASVGSLYMRTDGGANTTLYVKESGTGNTGWVAK